MAFHQANDTADWSKFLWAIPIFLFFDTFYNT